MQVVPRCGSPSLARSQVENHYSPTTVGAIAAWLKKSSVIWHKAGIDPQDTFIVVENVAAEIYVDGYGVSDMVVTMAIMPFSPPEYNTVIDHMRYSIMGAPDPSKWTKKCH